MEKYMLIHFMAASSSSNNNTDYMMNSSSPYNDDSTTDHAQQQQQQQQFPQDSLDRLYISLPPSAPRLPGPPTFGSNNGAFYPSSTKKHVQFHEARVVSFIEPGSSMSLEERNTLWYPTSDLDDFKNQVRDQCRKLRDGPTSSESTIPAKLIMGQLKRGDGSLSPPPPPRFAAAACQDLEDEDDSPPISPEGETQCPDDDGASPAAASVDDTANTRGLEHRVCLNRQRHKHLAIRCTLKAQSKSRCPEFIARISSKCTQWARDLALEEADRDYCEAWCPQKLLKKKSLMTDNPFPVPLKAAAATTTTKRWDEGVPSLSGCPSMVGGGSNHCGRMLQAAAEEAAARRQQHQSLGPTPVVAHMPSIAVGGASNKPSPLSSNGGCHSSSPSASPYSTNNMERCVTKRCHDGMPCPTNTGGGDNINNNDVVVLQPAAHQSYYAHYHHHHHHQQQQQQQQPVMAEMAGSRIPLPTSGGCPTSLSAAQVPLHHPPQQPSPSPCPIERCVRQKREGGSVPF